MIKNDFSAHKICLALLLCGYTVRTNGKTVIALFEIAEKRSYVKIWFLNFQLGNEGLFPKRLIW